MLSPAVLYLMHLQTSRIDLLQLERLIVNDRTAAETMGGEHIKAEDLTKGAIPIDQGTRVLFAVDAGPGKHTVTVASGGKTLLHLAQMRDSSLYIAVQTFYEGDAYLVDYQV